jgi:hypothetical protein
MTHPGEGSLVAGLRQMRRAVLLVVCCQAIGCSRHPEDHAHAPRPPSREIASQKDFFAFIARVETPLEASLARFQAAAQDGNDTALREKARETLAQARQARELVEKSRVARPLASARGEELVFLNHLVLGFQRYLESGSGPGRLEELASILERGRAHQKRVRVSPSR